MKRIVFVLAGLIAIGASFRVEAQNKEYLSVERPKDINITELLGSSYELPQKVFEQSTLSVNDDLDKTVTVERSPYGRGGSISWPMKDGSYARDTDFNVHDLFQKIAREVDDTSRKFILTREFPLFVEDEDEDISLVSEEPYIDLIYIGDGRIFTNGAPTPAWQLGTNTIHLVVFLSEDEAKAVKVLYDQAEKRVDEHYRKLDNDETDKGYIGDPRNEYTKKVLDLMIRRIET